MFKKGDLVMLERIPPHINPKRFKYWRVGELAEVVSDDGLLNGKAIMTVRWLSLGRDMGTYQGHWGYACNVD